MGYTVGMSPIDARVALVTGFPGFIGSRLVRRLLSDDPDLRIVALVERKVVERAIELAREMSERIVVEPGNIAETGLGLGEARFRELADSVTRVIHLAAIYDLAVPEAAAEAVNVNGTQHVIDFCRASRRLERHDYVSTAYVAGMRTGRVLESELDVGQRFKNHYESTKHRAERLVRASMKDIPTTIYRPGIVVGDSRTGETQKFDGPYYVLRFISRLSRLHLPIPQIASELAAFNVVPVDFIVDAMATGVRDPRFVGETLHLVDPSPVSAAELVRLLARAYVGKRPRWRLSPKVVDVALRSRHIRQIMAGIPRESVQYLQHPVTFDTTRATALLSAHDVRCPRFADYVDDMVRFFRAHEADEKLNPAR